MPGPNTQMKGFLKQANADAKMKPLKPSQGKTTLGRAGKAK